MRFNDIEVAICDRCGKCFSWHGETNGILPFLCAMNVLQLRWQIMGKLLFVRFVERKLYVLCTSFAHLKIQTL
jgi:hypothetical protein